jgi:hypothetical protein
MAAGQGAFSVAADVAALDVLEVRLSVREAERGAVHAAMLWDVLELQAVYSRSGMSVSTVPHVALALGCSEHRAGRLLAEALALAELPGGLEAVECGLLTVEQSATLVQQFAPIPLEIRLLVWRRLQARLCQQGVLPSARLAELLRRWVIAADRDAAEQRRRQAETGRRVDYRRRDDGLWDLFALGFRGPEMQAILSRVAARSVPVGLDDDRTADQRRFDALKDLLLGRESLSLERDCAVQAATRLPGAAACGCLPGSPVPCGAEVLVHVRWQAALEMSDEPAELVGHGPIEADLLQELLLAGPRLRAVWTDEQGVPVAVDGRVVPVPRDDPAALRQALLDLAKRRPPDRRSRALGDHAPAPAPVDERARPAARADQRGGTGVGVPPRDQPSDHLDDQRNPYRPPRRVRRLIRIRAPRCEWPGCGARAARCDDEHDLAWPAGPTCPCNLGPCCRHHHRVKQCGWTKTRHGNGSLTWTSPTGRTWLSPAQHERPLPATRPLPPLPTASPWNELSPSELEDELWALDLLPDDDLRNYRPPVDQEPSDRDRLGARIGTGDIRWTLDLDNPYLWLGDDGRTLR